MARKISLSFSILLLLLGIGLFLYPIANGLRLENEAAQAVESFVEIRAAVNSAAPSIEQEEISVLYPELFEAMKSCNEELYLNRQNRLTSPEAYEAPGFYLSDYDIDTGVIGVLSVPLLELELPIYLGANYDNMAAGAAHLTETSYPIGGENTNSVIAAHRGWNGADYFLHIDKLSPGDEVFITNLWGELKYTVAEIRVIEPHMVKEILIQPGRELLTLMSCHPPNSGGRFRYLVICKRSYEPV